MTLENNHFISKIKYLSFFVARAFLIAVICLLAVFGVLLFVYFGDLFINVKSGNYKNPLFNGYVIVSPSMVPTININDAILVKRENNDEYTVGDIISFFSKEYDSNGMIITHRIIDKKNQTALSSIYTTKGDNNSVADKENVSTDNIYGKVLFILPKLGYIQSFLSKPVNFICCIIIPALLIIVFDFMRVGIMFNKNKEYGI